MPNSANIVAQIHPYQSTLLKDSVWDKEIM